MESWKQIEHVVVLMLENRSFDNVLGWLHEHTPAGEIRYVPPGLGPPYLGLHQAKLGDWAQPLTTPSGTTSVTPRRGTTTHVTDGVAYHDSPRPIPTRSSPTSPRSSTVPTAGPARTSCRR